MTAIVDTFPYPWSDPKAQELHATLCQIYPTSKGAMFVAVRAGLQPAMLNGDQPSYSLWTDILDAGANALMNRQIVKLVRDQNPTNPKCPFLDALLAPGNAPIIADLQPRGKDGAPRFLSKSDEIAESEALLFHDDLMLPIGRVPWLIAVLERLYKVAPAICRLTVTGGGSGQFGTGFRIGDNLLLTNWHVLQEPGAPNKVVAEFGYEDDGKGGGAKSTAYHCDVQSIQGNAQDDWAVICTKGALPDSIPRIKLSEAEEPGSGDPAFVVQHPGGDRKRLAYVRNQLTDFDERVLHYLSDTQPGSSGSPVLNESARLVGLHHAGGLPQEVAGKPPLVKNEGIRIPLVRDGLNKLGVAFD